MMSKSSKILKIGLREIRNARSLIDNCTKHRPSQNPLLWYIPRPFHQNFYFPHYCTAIFTLFATNKLAMRDPVSNYTLTATIPWAQHIWWIIGAARKKKTWSNNCTCFDGANDFADSFFLWLDDNRLCSCKEIEVSMIFVCALFGFVLLLEPVVCHFWLLSMISCHTMQIPKKNIAAACRTADESTG